MRKVFLLVWVWASCALILTGCSGARKSAEPVETRQPEAEPLEPAKTGQEMSGEPDVGEDGFRTPVMESVDMSDCFHGMSGCAVRYRPEEKRYFIYNEAMAGQEVSPCSTFKIVSALLGLYNGVVEDASSTMDYSGAEYPRPEWNGDLTLQEAFQTSCIWYFRQIIDKVGREETERELKELSYGNGDVSEWEGGNTNPQEDLNGFWLNSSLKISPLEQVDVLAKIFEGESIYSEEDIETLKEIMLVEDGGQRRIYGKTGSGGNGEAWFVGFTEAGGEREYFAVYLSDPAQGKLASGSTAREIALEIVGGMESDDGI